jgi:hypothetical protein
MLHCIIFAPLAVMLAYRRPATLLALALDTLVVVDAGASSCTCPHMLSYLRPSTRLALALATPVVEDGGAPAYYASNTLHLLLIHL